MAECNCEDRVRELTNLLESMRAERKCSITLGTAAKGGEIKVYFDPLNPSEAMEIITNAYDIFADMKIQDSRIREGMKGL